MRVAPSDGVSALLEETPERWPLSSPSEDTARRSRHQFLGHCDFRFLSLQNGEKEMSIAYATQTMVFDRSLD